MRLVETDSCCRYFGFFLGVEGTSMSTVSSSDSSPSFLAVTSIKINIKMPLQNIHLFYYSDHSYHYHIQYYSH